MEAQHINHPNRRLHGGVMEAQHINQTNKRLAVLDPDHSAPCPVVLLVAAQAVNYDLLLLPILVAMQALSMRLYVRCEIPQYDARRQCVISF